MQIYTVSRKFLKINDKTTHIIEVHKLAECKQKNQYTSFTFTTDNQWEELVAEKTPITAIAHQIKYLGVNLPDMYKKYIGKLSSTSSKRDQVRLFEMEGHPLFEDRMPQYYKQVSLL